MRIVSEVFDTPLDVSDATTQQETNSEVSQTRHVGWTVPGANGRAVFTEYHVFVIVESVFYLPVEAVHGEELCRVDLWKRQVRDQENSVDCCLVGTNVGPGACDPSHLLNPRDVETCSACIDHYDLTLLEPTVPLVDGASGIDGLWMPLDGTFQIPFNLFG